MKKLRIINYWPKTIGHAGLAFLMCASLLCGCSKDNVADNAPDKTPESGSIRFDIGFAPTTRMATDVSFESTWEKGDAIGIYAVEHGKELNDSDNPIHNVKLTYDGSKWTGSIYWPGGNKTIDFYAYYPYSAESNPKKIAFSVKTDQRGTTGAGDSEQSNYSLSDLLTAKSDNGGQGWSKADGNVSLTFSHALAMIQVEIPFGKGWGPTESLTVNLKGVRSAATVNLNDISATGGSEVTLASTDKDPVKITMQCLVSTSPTGSKYVCRALIPAQELTSGTNLFQIADEGAIYNGKGPDAPLQLTAGQAEIFTRPIIHIETVPIKAGKFKMGSSTGKNKNDQDNTGLNLPPMEKNRERNETQHWVTLTKDFHMGKFEVSTSLFAMFMNDTHLGAPDEDWGYVFGNEVTGYEGSYIIAAGGSNSNDIRWNADKGLWEAVPDKADYPIYNVTWNGANAFAKWAGGSLPTEAQWEYACRAGTETVYSSGDDPKELFKYDWFDISVTGYHPAHEIGTKKPNPWGLYDMHGNISEWCLDWANLWNDYAKEPATDPLGLPSEGKGPLSRGGAASSNAKYCRSAYRGGTIISSPDAFYVDTGLRVIFQENK